MSHHKLNKKCAKCGVPILDRNKSGFCNHHRDRTGKNNPFFGHKHSQATKNATWQKLSRNSKENWKNDEYRNKVITRSSKPRHPGFGEIQRAGALRMYEEHPEQRQIRSERMKKSWKDGSIVSTGFVCNKSKLQLSLLEDIKKIHPGAAGDKTIRAADGSYLFPDILIDQLRLVIEFYGSYWHASPKLYKAKDAVHHKVTASQIWKHDEERLNKLTEMNYSVVVVWQDEYKNNKEVVLTYFNQLLRGSSDKV